MPTLSLPSMARVSLHQGDWGTASPRRALKVVSGCGRRSTVAGLWPSCWRRLAMKAPMVSASGPVHSMVPVC